MRHIETYEKPRRQVPAKTSLPLAEAVKAFKTFGGLKVRSNGRHRHISRLGIDPSKPIKSFAVRLYCRTVLAESKRVVVFAKGDFADQAKAAGADEVGVMIFPRKSKTVGLISMSVSQRPTRWVSLVRSVRCSVLAD